MTWKRYYHFVPTKLEEEEKGGSPLFPLHALGGELVDVRDDHPVLVNVFSPWDIKVVLTGNEVGNLGGLVLGREHVQSNWELDWCAVNHGEQASITIKDVDTCSEYSLYLKKWASDDKFMIHNNWIRDFVFRRDLKEGDMIGMYWNRQSLSFCFSVLRRAGTD